MRAPIARRRTTGARRLPPRRSGRPARVPLRRPLALLYRRSSEARSAAPAAVRGADGRPVPLAPRLQIALHLSFAFTEQHLGFAVPAAPGRAVPAMRAEGARPTEPSQRLSSTSERLILAARLRREPARRSFGEERLRPQGLAPYSARRTDATSASGHLDLVHRRPADVPLGSVGGAGAGQGSAHRTVTSGAAPPWPLREHAAVWISYIRGPLPGPDSPDRFGRPGGVAGGVASTRQPWAVATARRGASGTSRPGPAARLVYRDASPDAGAPKQSGTPFSALGGPRPPIATLVERRFWESDGTVASTSVTRARRGRPMGERPSPAGRFPQRPRLALAQAAVAAGAPGARRGPAAPARRQGRGPRVPLIGPAQPRPRAGAGIDRLGGERRAALPGASASYPRTNFGRAALGAAPPLYLAEKASGAASAPPPFNFAWAPPPLDLRSAAPPPAPPLAQEERSPAAAAPSAAPVDLGAVSRDVISRIEKRLRVERERRGRS